MTITSPTGCFRAVASAFQYSSYVRKVYVSSASREGGIAIVSVLMVLAVIMLLGIGSLVLTQSTLLMSENLVSNSIARANAEAGVDATVAWLAAGFEQGGDLPSTLEHAPATSLSSGSLRYDLASGDGYVLNPDGTVTLRIVGTGPRSAEHVSEALVAFEAPEGQGGGSPFQGAVIGCEGVTVSGSGLIDSYDSRVGPYQAHVRGRAAHVKTVAPGAKVTITGASPIYGSVNSTGAVEATGSARVVGDIHASGLVELKANAVYEGDVRTTGNVTVSNTATIHGSVSANGGATFTNVSTVRGDVYAGSDIRFTNGGKVNGNAAAGGTITQVGWTQNVLGRVGERAGPVNNLPVEPEECDPVDVAGLISSYSHVPTNPAMNVNQWPYWTWELNPAGVRQQHTDSKSWRDAPDYTTHSVELFGQEATLIRTSSVKVSSSGALRVSGGHVVLLVDGDFEYLGGGSGWVVDEGSSLTILVKGKVHVGSSQATRTAGGIPPINIFSSYRNTGNNPWNAGVRVSGAGRLDATIYAPYSDVGVTGSGALYGSVRGRTVSVTGNGDIHFDEALAETNMGGGTPVEGGERSVVILSRR